MSKQKTPHLDTENQSATALAHSATILPFRQKPAPSAEPKPPVEKDDRETVLAELWLAISEGKLVNHYQPQYDMATGEIVGVEALVRLRNRQGELVYPDRFIHEAEESGLIAPLSRLVIHTACRDLAHWRAAGINIQRLSINLSAYQINIDHDLPQYVQATMLAFGIKPSDLEFELTERQALNSDGPGMRNLRTLSAMGARLAIDDFGTGYSSVAYIAELPINTVKLDRSMVSRLPEENTARHVVRHLLQMARELGMTTVGEGVETEAQNALLADLGCDLGQGYLVAKPMDADAIRDFARKARSTG